MALEEKIFERTNIDTNVKVVGYLITATLVVIAISYIYNRILSNKQLRQQITINKYALNNIREKFTPEQRAEIEKSSGIIEKASETIIKKTKI